MTILKVNKLSKVYGDKQKYQALKDISFSVEKGEFVAIMGPSGSGKTTLLNIITKLQKETSGKVIYNLREEGECWAIFERAQHCIHVTVRKI